jgi:hypothetical protein
MSDRKLMLPQIAHKVFEEATASSLGSTFHIIISFHLKQKFGRDPYEILIENPKVFYNGLREVLGAGAEAVMNLVGTYLTVKYNTDFTVEEFTRLFTKDGETQRLRLSEIFENVVRQEEGKIKMR